MEKINPARPADYTGLARTLELAQNAAGKGYSPVGCVITDNDGRTLYEAESRRLIGTITHAEMSALLDLQRDSQPDWGAGLTMYCTLEPCLMCLGMALIARMSRIVWAINDYWGGASHIYNFDHPYLASRKTVLIPEPFADLSLTARALWVTYLASTGHAHMTPIVLGENSNAYLYQDRR